MDLNKLKKVTKANPINFPKRQDFDLLYMPKTGRFKFSEGIFADLSLEDNSLVQYNNYEPSEEGVYLHIVPGNTGVFLKKHIGKSKGRQFKNDELKNALSEFSIDVDEVKYLTLAYVDIIENYPMYKVLVDNERYERLVLKTAKPETETITLSEGEFDPNEQVGEPDYGAVQQDGDFGNTI